MPVPNAAANAANNRTLGRLRKGRGQMTAQKAAESECLKLQSARGFGGVGRIGRDECWFTGRTSTGQRIGLRKYAPSHHKSAAAIHRRCATGKRS